MIRRAGLKGRGLGGRAGRGFTLVEMLIYAGLVSVGLATFITIEVSARRNVALQGAILDVEGSARRCLDPWRRDVEAAKSITLKPSAKTQGLVDGLEIVHLDGRRIEYSLGKRVEFDAQGKKLGEDQYPCVTILSFKRTKRELEASISVQRSLGDKNLVRTYRRVATPRAASAVLKDTR